MLVLAMLSHFVFFLLLPTLKLFFHVFNIFFLLHNILLLFADFSFQASNLVLQFLVRIRHFIFLLLFFVHIEGFILDVFDLFALQFDSRSTETILQRKLLDFNLDKGELFLQAEAFLFRLLV